MKRDYDPAEASLDERADKKTLKAIRSIRPQKTGEILYYLETARYYPHEIVVAKEELKRRRVLDSTIYHAEKQGAYTEMRAEGKTRGLFSWKSFLETVSLMFFLNLPVLALLYWRPASKSLMITATLLVLSLAYSYRKNVSGIIPYILFSLTLIPIFIAAYLFLRAIPAMSLELHHSPYFYYLAIPIFVIVQYFLLTVIKLARYTYRKHPKIDKFTNFRPIFLPDHYDILPEHYESVPPRYRRGRYLQRIYKGKQVHWDIRRR